MKVKRLLEKYNESLNPSDKDRDEMYMKIFGEMPNENNNFFDIFMKNKVLQYSLMSVFVVAFIVIPFAPQILEDAKYRMNYDYDELEKEIDNYQPDDIEKDLNEIEDVRGDLDYSIDRDLNYTGGATIAPREEELFEDNQTPQDQRAVEKDGEITIEVGNVKKVHNEVMGLASEFNGYVIASNLTTNGEDFSRVVIRIPSDRFDALIEKLRDINGDIVAENLRTVDRQNRLTELTTIEANFKTEIDTLNAELAGTSDAARKQQIQDRLNVLNKEVESNVKKIDELKQETNFSTISVTLKEGESESILGDDWKDLGQYISTIAIFWIKVGILMIVPVVILIVVRKAKKKFKVKLDKQA